MDQIDALVSHYGNGRQSNKGGNKEGFNSSRGFKHPRNNSLS